MKLNRKWLLLVALVLSVAMATTGTLAYLTDQDADVNVMTLGKVEIVQNEQERDENGELQPFTPNKPALPAVGPIEWTTAGEGVDVNGTEYKVFTDDLKNVIDKIVTVTNTGKSDAYVRTIVAIEAPESDPNSLIHINWNGTDCSISEPIEAEIDGVDYVAFVFTYKEALAAGETSAPSLVQLFLDKATTNEDVEKFGDTWEVLVLSQAIQADGFPDAATALNEGFGEVDVKKLFGDWAEWDEDDIGSPGDKWPNNNPPSTLARVSMIDADRTLTNADGDATVVEPGRMIDTTDSKMGLDVGKIPLDVAYQFEPEKTLAEAEESEYRYWHADFVVSTNKTIPPFGIGLAGYYDAWCSLNNDKWVMLTSDTEIEANTEIRLVETLAQLSGWDITVNYEELCRYGNDGIGFLCGAVALDGHTWSSETISAELEPGTVLTVELRMYETEEPSAENGNSHNVETGEFITVGTFTYTFN